MNRLGVLALLVCSSCMAAYGCGSGGVQTSDRASAARLAADPRAAAGGISLQPGESLVAHVRRRAIRIHHRPQPGATDRVLRNPNPDGFPLVLLVKRAQPGWLQVYLPVRPDGSTGWVRAADVSTVLTSYRLRVDLTRHRLTVWHGQDVIDRQPIGVGRALTPTPAGTYFITELFRLTEPNGPWGPYGFGLSGFSNVLHAFAGGNGEIGIHGTNDPAGIGSNVSHGCIRLSNRAISRLASLLPLGTPVSIVR